MRAHLLSVALTRPAHAHAPRLLAQRRGVGPPKARKARCVAVKAQQKGSGESNSNSSSSKPSQGKERKRRGGRNRRKRSDPVLRRKERQQSEEEALSETEPNLVDPVALGRRARKEVDSAWKKFTRLGQFASVSVSESPEITSASELEAQTQAVDTRVLVIGATGQVGRVVLNKLLLRGYTVRAMVRSISDEVLENIPPAVELIKGDIASLNDTFEATRDCDKVICCARARSNLLADQTRVENEGVKNVVTSMLHHKNENAINKSNGKATQHLLERKNKVVLFKFQNHKKKNKWGKWKVEGPDVGEVAVRMPDEENKCLVFEGTSADLGEATSPLKLAEGSSLKGSEGLVLNCHGMGKKFAVVLYSEDEQGRHGYISEFSTLETGYCTRRIPFSAFTRLNADQPALNLKNVKEIGLRYRSIWNKESNDPSNFRVKVAWMKALPSGAESDVILVSCADKVKRAGEAHLRNSGLGYTIIRPSSLFTNAPAGEKALVFDQEGKREEQSISQSISVADVADVCFRACFEGEAYNKTFSLSSVQEDESFELIASRPADYLTAALKPLEKNS